MRLVALELARGGGFVSLNPDHVIFVTDVPAGDGKPEPEAVTVRTVEGHEFTVVGTSDAVGKALTGSK